MAPLFDTYVLPVALRSEAEGSTTADGELLRLHSRVGGLQQTQEERRVFDLSCEGYTPQNVDGRRGAHGWGDLTTTQVILTPISSLTLFTLLPSAVGVTE